MCSPFQGAVIYRPGLFARSCNRQEKAHAFAELTVKTKILSAIHMSLFRSHHLIAYNRSRGCYSLLLRIMRTFQGQQLVNDKAFGSDFISYNSISCFHIMTGNYSERNCCCYQVVSAKSLCSSPVMCPGMWVSSNSLHGVSCFIGNRKTLTTVSVYL